MRIMSVLILMAITMTSCAVSTVYMTDDAKSKTTKTGEQVQILLGKPTSKYEIIGVVACDVLGGGEAAAKYLKEKAAAMGANAIVDSKLTKVNTIAQRTGMSGVAVRIVN